MTTLYLEDRTGLPGRTIELQMYPDEAALIAALKADDLWKHCPEDTIAFTDCIDGPKIGKFYLIDGVDHDTVAHEATHMALHCMSLLGHESLPIVKAGERAPQIEEDLCGLVGYMTEIIYGGIYE